MRNVYRVLAGLIALGVVIQSMAMVYAIAGLGIWVDQGGVLDRTAFEGEESLFPEDVGFAVHGLNGTMVIPALALLLLVASFFAGVAGATKRALLVLGLVVLQVALGLFGHELAALGALHGINALVLLGAAVWTARSARPVVGSAPRQAQEPAAG